MNNLDVIEIEVVLNLIREKIEEGGKLGELAILRDIYEKLSLDSQLVEALIDKNKFSSQLKEIDNYLKMDY